MRVVVSPALAETIRHLPPGLKRSIRQALRIIGQDPGCGEPLERELAGYLKFKLRGFRIIYTVDRAAVVVRILAIGSRATVYQRLAEQYLDSGVSEEDR